MRKRTRYKSPLPDILALLICLAGIFWFGRLFWLDLNSTSARSDQEEIGVITFKRNVAQRRFGDRVVWERVPQSAPVYNADILRTTPDASATITFKDGTSLELNENTMLQLYYTEDGGLMLDVDGGGVQVAAGKGRVSLSLSDGSSVDMAQGASVSASSQKGGSQSIEVLGGAAAATSANGKTERLSEGQSAVISENGGITRKALTVLYPKKESVILNPGRDSPVVKFSWSLDSSDFADGGSGEPVPVPVTVQISKNKDFSSIESSSVAQSGNSLELDSLDGIPSQGSVWWRAFAGSEIDGASSGKITVEKIPEIIPLSPAQGSEFRYREKNPRVAFRWNGNDWAQKYKLSVSSSPNMENPIFQTETAESTLDISSLGAGNYYWRVEPFYSAGNLGYSGSSETRAFTVLRDEKIKPPELSSPADGAEITYRDSPSLLFIWKSEITASDYDFILSRDETFRNVIYSSREEKSRASFAFENVQALDGSYWWKVVRHSNDPDDIQNESVPRSFILRRYVPQKTALLFPPENFTAEEDKISSAEFIWRLDDKFAGKEAVSVLQISDSADFSRITGEWKTEAVTFSGLHLGEGKYWWRVGVEDENIFTPPRAFSVAGGLSTPVFISPRANQEFLSAGNQSVRVAWSPVRGADYYSLSLFDSTGTVLEENQKFKATEISYSVPQGNYRAQVQAFAESGSGTIRKGPVSEVAFSLRVPRGFRTLSPANGARISGLAALQSGSVFTWEKSADDTGSYIFILRRRGSNGAYSEIRREETRRNSIEIPRLSEGSYEWLVRSSTRSGESLATPASLFAVDAIPRLALPAQVFPRDGGVLGASYFKSNRSVSFNWNSVPNATSYSFALYKAGGMRPIFERTLTGGGRTEVVISDLSLFDVGTFEWRVTAFRHNSAGLELQRSQTASAVFEINFSLPDEVWSKKPGAMYAE